MIASQASEQTFIPTSSGRMARILIGASVFSGLTVGLGFTATHLLNPSGGDQVPAKLSAERVVPSLAKKIIPAAAAGTMPVAVIVTEQAKPEAKTARVVLHEPEGIQGAGAPPLSSDAFDRRFVAPVSASALPQARPQHFAANVLLAAPQPEAVRTAFATRIGDLPESGTFRMAQSAAPVATPAQSETVVALAVPGDLPHALDIEPTPAPERAAPKQTTKADPRSGGKLRDKPAAVEADDDDQKPLLRPGRTAKAPVVVAALPDKPDVPSKPKTLWQALGFARPDNPEDAGGAGKNIPWPGGAKKVAYYDISAQKVYMPNGETMEAHSGQGKLRDNPAYVHVKMRGPTPPSTYRLSMRETLFHGVQALRLTPTNGINPHGRVGLLTHSYLRRVPGDSAGCIVFKDYPRFLAAYKRGQVDHVVVVSSMSKGKGATVASLFSRSK